MSSIIHERQILSFLFKVEPKDIHLSYGVYTIYDCNHDMTTVAGIYGFNWSKSNGKLEVPYNFVIDWDKARTALVLLEFRKRNSLLVEKSKKVAKEISEWLFDDGVFFLFLNNRHYTIKSNSNMMFVIGNYYILSKESIKKVVAMKIGLPLEAVKIYGDRLVIDVLAGRIPYEHPSEPHDYPEGIIEHFVSEQTGYMRLFGSLKNPHNRYLTDEDIKRLLKFMSLPMGDYEVDKINGEWEFWAE